MNDVDVLVVGGGISGLASAWWLARTGLSVAVWERATRPGGKIRSHCQDGYTTERAAALIMNFRPEVNQLLAETGLDASKILPGPCANRHLVRDGRLLPLPMTLAAMIASPMWSRRARLRMALEPFIPRGRRQHETVAEFIRRRLGRDMLEQAMEPYVAGPLASSPELAEARAVLPRLTALEQRYGSLALGCWCTSCSAAEAPAQPKHSPSPAVCRRWWDPSSVPRASRSGPVVKSPHCSRPATAGG